MKINSDDESIPYKKDTEEDSPEPSDPVRISDQPYSDTVRVAETAQNYPDGGRVSGSSQPYAAGQPFSYTQPAPPPLPSTSDQGRSAQWTGETEIN